MHHLATPYNTLQHPATPCNALQHTVTHCMPLTATHYNTLKHTATHCNTVQRKHWRQQCSITKSGMQMLQRTATKISALQCFNSATHRNTTEDTATQSKPLRHCNTMLQNAATHANTLQHTATHCNTLQHTATHCNTLQHTAIRCNAL